MNLLSTLLVGTMFGLSAGLSPGPLMTLVITQTLKHNSMEGLRVAVAPVLTDIPIILISFLILTKLSVLRPVLGLISVTGGFYVLYLSYETIRNSPLKSDKSLKKPRSLRQGILVNALNPHPYLFWITVGAPFIFKKNRVDPIAPWVFIFSFYLFLIGSKVLTVQIVGRFKTFIEGKVYLYIMRGLGLLLAVFALFLFWEASVQFRAIAL